MALRTASSPLRYANSISIEPSSSNSADPSPETSSISSKPSQVNPTEARLYSMSRPACSAPKAISPRPFARMTIVAGRRDRDTGDPRCRPRRSASGRRVYSSSAFSCGRQHDRRPPNRRIQRRLSFVHKPADSRHWMALASASFKIEMNAKRSGPPILASHPPASAKTRKDRITPRFLSPANFSTAC